MYLERQKKYRWILNGKRVPASTPGARKTLERSPYYSVVIPLHGKGKKKITLKGVTNKEVAMQYLLRMKQEGADSLLGLSSLRPDAEDHPIGNLLKLYLKEQRSSGNSSAYVQGMSYYLENFFRGIPQNYLSQLRREELSSHLESKVSRKGKKWSARARNYCRQFLVRFGRWCKKHRYWKKNLFKGIPTFKGVAVKVRRPLTLRQIQKLIRAARLRVLFQLVQGNDADSLVMQPLATHISVTRTLDPPAEKAETAAFMARAMAEELQQQLTEKGLGCTRIVVGIETEKGDYLERVWRCETSLSVAGIVDRVRWQLDGWLNSATRPNAGVSRLLLTPDEVGPNDGRQYGFWGQESSFDTRADRAFTRIAAFAGATAVRVPLVVGGRLPDERVQLLAYAGNDRTALRSSAHAPWPGSLPSPLPALSVEWPVQVVDEHDELVRVSARGELSGTPTSLFFSSHRFVIEQWAGPWLFDERWWDAETQTRRACFQLVVRQGRAFLVEVRSGEWRITGVYD